MTNSSQNPITTPDWRAERLAAIKRLYPDLFTDEGKINQIEIGALVTDGSISLGEKFEFRWPGKMQAKKNAFTSSKARLAPVMDRSVNFDETKNVIIEGENLEVLKLLSKAYYNKVKCIYIDPPYNTGHDFVYSDDYSEGKQAYWEKNGVFHDGVKVDTNSESAGRYHTNWLNMMMPRLLLAQMMLKDDGAIFVSIDDNEVHNLRKLMDEIFGEENFIESLVWNKRIPKNDEGIGSIHEYVLIYVKNSDLKHEFRMRKEGLEDIDALLAKLKKQKVSIPEAETEIAKLYKKKGFDRGITLYNSLDSEYRLWGKINMSWPNADTFGPRYDVIHPETGKPVKVPDRGWRWKKETFDEASGYRDGKYSAVIKLHDGTFLCGKIWFGKDEGMQPSSVNLLDEVKDFLLRSIVSLKSDGGVELENLFEGKSYFSYPKPTELLKTLIGSVAMKKDELILDFFAGSGTTGQAVSDLNKEDDLGRKFVLVQIPEATDEASEAFKAGYKTISNITIERVKRAGARIHAEKPDVDVGFKVFKLTTSIFPENTYQPDPEKSVEENVKALQEHYARARQRLLFDPAGKETDLMYETLIKHGFMLTMSKEQLGEFEENIVWKVTDGDRRAIVCLDAELKDSTVKALARFKDNRFIGLHRAVDTTKKWELTQTFGEALVLI